MPAQCEQVEANRVAGYVIAQPFCELALVVLDSFSHGVLQDSGFRRTQPFNPPEVQMHSGFLGCPAGLLLLRPAGLRATFFMNHAGSYSS